MLTGKRLFDGETISETLAAVLTKEPDWEQVPPKVRRLLRSCLQKDPKQRLQAIGDWRLLLDEQVPGQAETGPSRMAGVAWIVAAALGVIAAGGFFGWWRATRPVERPLIRLSVDLGPE